jgi:hypothetical protein
MPSPATLAETAALIGDPARAAMLAALLDGRRLPPGSSPDRGVTPPDRERPSPRSQAGLLAGAAGAAPLPPPRLARRGAC